MKRKIILIAFIVFTLLVSTNTFASSPRIAIGEFEAERNLQELTGDMDNLFLDGVLKYWDGSVQMKERIRFKDLIKDKQISSSDTRKLRRSLEADFLVLPRINFFEVEEVGSLSLWAIISGDSTQGKGEFKVDKNRVKISLSARIVCLHTGDIHSGTSVKKTSGLTTSKISINRRDFGSKDIKLRKVMEEAADKLAMKTTAEFQMLKPEKIERKENADLSKGKATVIEYQPLNIKNMAVAEVEDRSFSKADEVKIYRRHGEAKIPIGVATVTETQKGDQIMLIEVRRLEVEKLKKGDIIK